MYKIILKRGNYATITKNGKELEAMAGIFVTTADLAEMNELVRLANEAAQQSVHPDGATCQNCKFELLSEWYFCPRCGHKTPLREWDDDHPLNKTLTADVEWRRLFPSLNAPNKNVDKDVCHSCGKPLSEHRRNRVGHKVCP